jgi:ABC-type lipoprotein export system ATPase subunit
MSMISIRQVHKFHGQPPTRNEVLCGIDLEVPRGQFLAIMGPSGCGKSTLLHLLAGLDVFDAGDIEVAGVSLAKLDDRGLTLLRRQHVGIVFQFFNLLPTLTALENVELPALLRGIPPAQARARAASRLDEVGLSPRAHQQMHQLSGGEMQRIAFARALIMEPPILLADEPTGNLDSQSSAQLVELMRGVGRDHGTTIVMVTHSPEIAAAADRLIEMRDGRIRTAAA